MLSCSSRRMFLALVPFALALCACTQGTGDATGNEPVNRTEYPEGPYGVADGSVIDNHSFVRPDGSTLDFQSIREDESKSLLLISTAAGWCTACIEEQGFLEAQYNEKGDDGLTVLVSLFEDRDFQPADPDLVEAWIETHDLTFPVVADAPFVLGDYYDPEVTPMNMLVDLNTMEILHIVTGTDQSAIEALIDRSL